MTVSLSVELRVLHWAVVWEGNLLSTLLLTKYPLTKPGRSKDSHYPCWK